MYKTLYLLIKLIIIEKKLYKIYMREYSHLSQTYFTINGYLKKNFINIARIKRIYIKGHFLYSFWVNFNQNETYQIYLFICIKRFIIAIHS